LIKECQVSQKINIANNIGVFLGQGLKSSFDKYADIQMKQIVENQEYADMNQLYNANKAIMCIDALIIFLSAISLYKYTQKLVPRLEIIKITIITFISGTFMN
jgi:hypothetical protein